MVHLRDYFSGCVEDDGFSGGLHSIHSTFILQTVETVYRNKTFIFGVSVYRLHQ